jgi:PAS domain S-box-containing protein
VEKRGLKRFQARTYMCFGNMVMPWTRHVRTGRDLVRRAFDAASQIGDLTFAAYSCNHLITNLLAAGEELAAVQREAQNGLAFARTVGFGLIIDDISAQLGLIRNLRGLTRQFGSFNDDEFDEHQFERHLLDDSVVAEAECWYFIRKLIAHFLAGDYASAVSASLRAERLLWTSPSQFETAELHFYGGLSHAASWDMALPAQKQQHLEALTAHHRQLEIWASNCPENFRNRAALVKAEIGRIEGRELEAERLYQQAIDSSRANSFVHNEAVASEVAARFYATRGFELIAHAYLRAARHGYLRWGAIGKVRQLEGLYPHLEEEKAIVGSISTIGAAVEQLDLATVLGVSQAVSGEIALDKLIDTIVRMALVQAGAERGLLITLRGDEYQIEAEATTSSDNVTVALCKATSTFADVPETILNYVVRTKERVLLHDASNDNQFSSDQYIRRHYARSVLCMPLLRQTRLVGVLYLENNLAAHVFTLARMTVLTLLASQAAISLENIRLYDDLQDREAKMRRLVESNIIGIFIWRADGCIIDANEAYLRIIGYDRGDLLAGRLNWRDFTPPQWRDADDRGVAQLEASGTAQAYEKEYLRKDGTRVSVLVGTTVFEGKSNEGVGFVLDLTERKHAEESLRESERRYHEAQMELAHANRVVAMGQLSASIAHEVNQPVAAAVINAQAGLRRLGEIPPDLERARQALDRIVANGTRAGEVIGRMRALLKKTNLRKEEVEINGVIREVIALICREATEKGISVQTSLTESLPRIQGDRIQLQQVMLNLVINAVEALGSVRDGFRNLMIRTNEVKSDEVLVVVQDSGPGLALPDLERVFDAFYTTKPDGLGMGLSICRSIVEAHGGRLWAAPNTPNGAVFQFTLPAR